MRPIVVVVHQVFRAMAEILPNVTQDRIVQMVARCVVNRASTVKLLVQTVQRFVNHAMLDVTKLLKAKRFVPNVLLENFRPKRDN